MRFKHFVAIAGIALFVAAIKLAGPTITAADAYAVQAATLNVLQLQADYRGSLPQQLLHDMMFALD